MPAQPRSTQRYLPRLPQDEARLREAMVAVAPKYGGCGYRLVRGMLRRQGWQP